MRSNLFLVPTKFLCSLIFATILLNGVLFESSAGEFKNSYVSFQLPDHWKCLLEGTEWVCSSQMNGATKDAVIILTAKEVGPNDSLAAYEAYLNSAKTISGPGGKPIVSRKVSVKQRMIGNQAWVDGLHFGSEVGTFYTRYLATVRDRLAILVTFSAHKDSYEKFSNDFLTAINTLNVVASKEILMGTNVGTGPRPTGIKPLIGITDDKQAPPPPSSSGNSMLIGLILIAVAVIVYLLLKSKPGPKKKK